MSLLTEFLKVARWIGRSEDPFIDFPTTFDVGMSADGAESDDEEHDSDK